MKLIKCVLSVSLFTLGLVLWSVTSAVAASGDLDPTFGSGGKVLTTIGNSASANTVAIQADGKIVVGGRYLVRYDTNGSFDTTFGQVIVDFIVSTVLIQSDGKIVVAGESIISSTATSR